MTKYTFKIRDSEPKKNGEYSGYYFSIELRVNGSPRSGQLLGETWFQGCGLNGLNGFTNCSHWPVECVPDLIEFLSTVRSGDPIDGAYTAKRFIISLTNSQLEYPFIKALTDEAEKLKEFDNLAHGPRKICLFLLTTV